jgi:hypothetical protein
MYGHLMPEIQSGAADLMVECVSPVEVVLQQTAPEMHQDSRDTSKESIITPYIDKKRDSSRNLPQMVGCLTGFEIPGWSIT